MCFIYDVLYILHTPLNFLNSLVSRIQHIGKTFDTFEWFAWKEISSKHKRHVLWGTPTTSALPIPSHLPQEAPAIEEPTVENTREAQLLREVTNNTPGFSAKQHFVCNSPHLCSNRSLNTYYHRNDNSLYMFMIHDY